MTDSGYPILAREGWWHTVSAVAVAALVHFFAGYAWAIPFWIFAAFIIQFFRDPPRQIPDLPGGVICPADGTIIAQGEVDDPYLKRRAKRLSVFMNVFDVHSNRIPVTGKVQECWYNKGKFINASLDKASSDNERNAMWIKTDQGQDVVVVQVAGLIARRILCYVQSGERVTLGERYGFIRFGSRVDVYLPLNAQFRVSLGDKVKGAADVIAQLT
ncbi:MAG: phosphatidylserine decarboxylase [Sulfuricaulis sp.]|uniref:phosphatidylserine decarboxylase n=1 Tax=Sulfuricaulis sp. TaxID=2003553 RepID=UPI0034A39905